MGNSLESYRAAIGLFNCRKHFPVVTMTLLRHTLHVVLPGLFPLFVLCLLLLLAGDVELNPGPKENIKREISISQLNIQSLHIIALTEILLRPHTNLDFSIEGFCSLIGLDRSDRGGGGWADFFQKYFVCNKTFTFRGTRY